MRKQKVKKGEKLILSITCYSLALAIFGIALVFAWVGYFDQFEIAAIIDRNLVVKATLTEVRHGKTVGETLGPGAWFVLYEYTSEDGFFYRGVYKEYNINREEEANAQIGKQVEIYIDGEGKRSFPSFKRPAFERQLTIAIILTVLAAGVVAFITVREILIAKDKKLLKQIRGHGV